MILFRGNDYKRAVAGADGKAEVTFGPFAIGRTTRIERIVVKTTSAGTPTAAVYIGSKDAENIVDFTKSGKNDVADESSPILIAGNQPLIIEWTDAANGDVCTARLQYLVEERAPTQEVPV